jgi:hypothetical protein
MLERRYKQAAYNKYTAWSLMSPLEGLPSPPASCRMLCPFTLAAAEAQQDLLKL